MAWKNMYDAPETPRTPVFMRVCSRRKFAVSDEDCGFHPAKTCQV